MTYNISHKPLADVSVHGYLAYVSEKDRTAIKNVGFGEMDAHIAFIKSRVGQLAKLKKKRPALEQFKMEFPA